jgi:hypothetical protein
VRGKYAGIRWPVLDYREQVLSPDVA